MAVIVNDGEIVLTGMVGENFWDDGFTAAEVIAALAQIGRDNPVTVRVNSGGGYATEGAAIHAAMKAHRGDLTVIVEGIAASAASLIAVAGDTVIMALGSTMMIHDTATITWGTARDHQMSIDMLNALSNSYAEVYADKTGGTVAEMRELMRAETWFTAQEAVAAKFADSVGAANSNEPTAFAYGVYAHAPERIVAMADAKGWKAPSAKSKAKAKQSPPAPTAPSARQTQEPTMTEKTTAELTSEASKAATARIKAIMTHDNAKGRAALAEHLAYETETDADAAIALLGKAEAKSDNVESFEQRKVRAQGDGLGGPGEPLKPQVQATWKKVTDRVNARRR